MVDLYRIWKKQSQPTGEKTIWDDQQVALCLALAKEEQTRCRYRSPEVLGLVGIANCIIWYASQALKELPQWPYSYKLKQFYIIICSIVNVTRLAD